MNLRRQPTSPVPRGMARECCVVSCGVCGDERQAIAHDAPGAVTEMLAAGWRQCAAYGLVCPDCHAAATMLTKRRKAYGQSLAAKEETP